MLKPERWMLLSTALRMRDKEIFQRVVKAMTERDTARANILATELGEIRKVEKMLSHASLALAKCFHAA